MGVLCLADTGTVQPPVLGSCPSDSLPLLDGLGGLIVSRLTEIGSLCLNSFSGLRSSLCGGQLWVSCRMGSVVGWGMRPNFAVCRRCSSSWRRGASSLNGFYLSCLRCSRWPGLCFTPASGRRWGLTLWLSASTVVACVPFSRLRTAGLDSISGMLWLFRRLYWMFGRWAFPCLDVRLSGPDNSRPDRRSGGSVISGRVGNCSSDCAGIPDLDVRFSLPWQGTGSAVLRGQGMGYRLLRGNRLNSGLGFSAFYFRMPLSGGGPGRGVLERE